jgi:hypothetical protein
LQASLQSRPLFVPPQAGGCGVCTGLLGARALVADFELWVGWGGRWGREKVK